MLVVFLLFKNILGCIGTGYTCDKGALEIHLPIDSEKIENIYRKADVKPYGQTWGVKGNLHIYYTDIKPVLLYVFENGIRFQIAIKNFGVKNDLSSEYCEFWENPENLDAKFIVRSILKKLVENAAINLTSGQIEKNC